MNFSWFICWIKPLSITAVYQQDISALWTHSRQIGCCRQLILNTQNGNKNWCHQFIILESCTCQLVGISTFCVCVHCSNLYFFFRGEHWQRLICCINPASDAARGVLQTQPAVGKKNPLFLVHYRKISMSPLFFFLLGNYYEINRCR